MSARDWPRNARGEWYVLAQAVLVLLVLLAPGLDGSPPAMALGAATVAGVVLCAIGTVFAALGSLGLNRGRGLSAFPRPRDEARLVDTGIFSLVRHPIYAGLILLALGWSLLWTSLAALAATVVLFIFFDLKSRREERWLEEKFDGYARYKARVRKFVPFIY